MDLIRNIFKKGDFDPETSSSFQREERGGVTLWRFTQAPSQVQIIFTTRRGGVSRPPHDSLNLGFHVGDLPADVRQNRDILAGALGLDPSQITCPRQLHTAVVEELSDKSEAGSGAFSEESMFDPCDGLVTSLKNAPILLHLADCAPVVLAGLNERKEPVLAVLHAGRRGLVEGIIEEGVDAMRETYGLNPEIITSAVGPAIGPCCYQVGDEVAAEFESRFGSESLFRNDEGTWLDIQSAADISLIRAGLLPENIHVLEICTCCDEDFYSYRRDGVTGRHGAIAWIE